MRSVWLSLLSFAASSCGACAQPADAALSDNQNLGMRLFNQSCQICHTTVVLTGRLYGPVLSKDSLGGQEDVLREVISNGTPRMPGLTRRSCRSRTVALPFGSGGALDTNTRKMF